MGNINCYGLTDKVNWCRKCFELQPFVLITPLGARINEPFTNKLLKEMLKELDEKVSGSKYDLQQRLRRRQLKDELAAAGVIDNNKIDMKSHYNIFFMRLQASLDGGVVCVCVGGIICRINVYIMVTAVRTYMTNRRPPTFAFCLQSYRTTRPTLIPERKHVLRPWGCNLDAIWTTNGTQN